jgi:hypothetical protein
MKTLDLELANKPILTVNGQWSTVIGQSLSRSPSTLSRPSPRT